MSNNLPEFIILIMELIHITHIIIFYVYKVPNQLLMLQQHISNNTQYNSQLIGTPYVKNHALNENNKMGI